MPSPECYHMIPLPISGWHLRFSFVLTSSCFISRCLSPCYRQRQLSTQPNRSATRKGKKLCLINLRSSDFRRSQLRSPDHHLSLWLPQCLRTEGYYNGSSPGLPTSQVKGVGYITRKMETTATTGTNSHFLLLWLSIHLLVIRAAQGTSDRPFKLRLI